MSSLPASLACILLAFPAAAPAQSPASPALRPRRVAILPFSTHSEAASTRVYLAPAVARLRSAFERDSRVSLLPLDPSSRPRTASGSPTGAGYFIVGALGSVGDGRNWISVQVIRVETSEIVTAGSFDFTSQRRLTAGVDSMAQAILVALGAD